MEQPDACFSGRTRAAERVPHTLHVPKSPHSAGSSVIEVGLACAFALMISPKSCLVSKLLHHDASLKSVLKNALLLLRTQMSAGFASTVPDSRHPCCDLADVPDSPTLTAWLGGNCRTLVPGKT